MEVSHCQKQSTSTRLNCIAADSSWYLRVFQINQGSCISRDRNSSWLQQQQPVRVCQVPRNQGYCCSPGWKSSSLPAAAIFPHLLTSDSSKVAEPDPKLSQLRQQNSVLPALLRSLAPALTPVLLVLLPLICGSHVLPYKVCGARNRAPRSYRCLCLSSHGRDNHRMGWT